MSFATPRLNRYFSDYSKFHKTPGNKATHYIGITLIVLSLLGLLSQYGNFQPLGSTSLLRLDAAVGLLVLGLFWYLWLDWKIAIPFIFVLTGMYFIGRALPSHMNWILFIAGWILQGIGHYCFEKKSPAFFKNLTHLLIGPLWIFSRIIRYHR